MKKRRSTARSRRVFHIDVVAEQDGQGFYVTVPALPGCFSAGRTVEEATRNAREAIDLHLEVLREAGHRSAAPRETGITVERFTG